jgi:hypothetical protein
MRIGGIASANETAIGRRPIPQETVVPNPHNRALVALEPPARRTGASLYRPLRPEPAVVAQLFACRDGFPQTRDKRRATASDATASYASVRRAVLASRTPKSVATDQST